MIKAKIDDSENYKVCMRTYWSNILSLNKCDKVALVDFYRT
jgi:hypothetical protein